VPPDRTPVPSTVAPFRKVTLPLGVPERAAVTVTVRVTAWPFTDGLGDTVSFVVVGD